MSKFKSRFTASLPRDRRRFRANPLIEALEGRKLMTVDAFVDGSTLNINVLGNDAVSVRVFADGNSLRVDDLATNSDPAPVTLDRVTKIVFNGGPGGDKFTNDAAIDSLINGNGGNDNLAGGSKRDVINGGDGLDGISGGDGNDELHGGDSRDLLSGGKGDDQLFGEAGNDYLVGGDNNDILHGGDDNDELFGDAGRDQLFGESGIDSLHGGDDSDFLDAGSPSGENVDGGNGQDFDAQHPVLNGTTAADVKLGNDGNQRAYLASLAGVANSGVNLAGRITYLGDAKFRVQLFKRSGLFGNEAEVKNVTVTFNGTLNANEATPVGEEFWTVLFHRAHLQLGSGVSAKDSLFELTGKEPDVHDRTFGLDFSSDDTTRIENGLANHKPVVVKTRPDSLTNSSLSTNRSYTLLGVVTRNNVIEYQLRDPASDTIIEITRTDFKKSFEQFVIGG